MNRSYDSPLTAPTRLALHFSRLVADAGVLLVLGAMSLSFVTAEGFHQRSVAGDALPVLVLVAPIFLMTLLPDQSAPLPRPLTWVALFLAAAALALAVITYFDAATLAGSLPGSVGMGPKVLVLGAFITLAGATLGLLPAPPRPAHPGPFPGEERPARRAGRAPEPARGARSPRPAAAPASRTAAGRLPAAAALPADAGRQFPRWRRPAKAAAPAAASPAAGTRQFPRWGRPGPAASPEPAFPPAASPAAAAPAGRLASRPRPAERDSDTEPTLPGTRPVQGWWPDDLEDLFS